MGEERAHPSVGSRRVLGGVDAVAVFTPAEVKNLRPAVRDGHQLPATALFQRSTHAPRRSTIIPRSSLINRSSCSCGNFTLSCSSGGSRDSVSLFVPP